MGESECVRIDLYGISILFFISHTLTLIFIHDDFSRFELTNIRVARSYFIQVQAPSGYLFTGGVCNNNVEGWECESSAETFAAGGGRRQRRLSLRGLNTANVTAGDQVVNPDARLPSQRDLELGLREGRTDRCVSVDEAGVPDSRFDLGVMRVGDHNFADTDVVVGVDMIGVGRELHHSPHEGRSLLELIQERLMERHGRALDSHQQTKNSDGLYVYELAAREEEAIGEVTAEVCYYCALASLTLICGDQ